MRLGIGFDMCTCQQLLCSPEKCFPLITRSMVERRPSAILPTLSDRTVPRLRDRGLWVRLFTSDTASDSSQSAAHSRCWGTTAERLNYVFHPRCCECAVCYNKWKSSFEHKTTQLGCRIFALALGFGPSLASTRLLCLDAWWALPPSGLRPCPDPKDSDNSLSINQLEITQLGFTCKPMCDFCCGLLVSYSKSAFLFSNGDTALLLILEGCVWLHWCSPPAPRGPTSTTWDHRGLVQGIRDWRTPSSRERHGSTSNI